MITETKLYADGQVISNIKTIKIIDLLNKIANGEEPKIKYDNVILKYNKKEERFIDKDGLNSLYEIDFSKLNDEVEIIEEYKENKLEKIQKNFNLYLIDSKIDCESKDGINNIINELIRKVDELIDEINNLKKENYYKKDS